MHYIYLHGFASSPKSSKAQYLHNCFLAHNLHLNILDLNQGDFANLTLTRQIEQTVAALPDVDTSVTLIGSSFGALTSAWVAQKHHQVQRMVLLAPAFGFPQSWYSRLESNQIQQWRESGYLPVEHYGENQQIPLKYQFLEDAENYSISQLKRALPTLIIHGLNDRVIPIQVSRDYACQHEQVKVIELDSDHGLNDSHTRIWQEISDFIAISQDGAKSI